MFYEDEEENNDPYASIKSQQVRDYMRQRAEAKKQLDADQQSQKIGDYAGVAGDIASGFVNANKPSDVILHNNWQGMGSAPKVSKVEDQKIDFGGAKSILDSQAARSKAAYDQVDKDFDSSIKAGQLDKSLQRDDPTSKSSKSAQTLARSALASKAKEAEAAGDRDGAKALREMDVSGMSAAEAKEFYDGVKMTDYKDVLNNNAADRRMKFQEDSANRRTDREAKRTEDKQKDFNYKRSVSVREELNKNTVYKNAQESDLRLSQVDELMKNPSGVNDEAILVMYQKALDPGSVVREGEFARTAEGQSLLGRIDTIMQRYKKGERMTPELRTQVLNTMKSLQAGNRTAMQRMAAPYEREIRDYNLDRSIIFGPEDQPTAGVAAPSGKKSIMHGGDLP